MSHFLHSKVPQNCSQHILQSAHKCYPMFRPHLLLLGRRLQRQTRDRKHLSITALQPRVPIKLPDRHIYKSSLLHYKVGELRDELTRRKADNRGNKVLLVDRLFRLLQEEAGEKIAAKQQAAEAAATAAAQPVIPKAPPRTRRGTDASTGLQLRRTSQQHTDSKESTASQIVQSMQSMPPAHAKQAAFAVRRTLVNKLAVAAKASAAKQQQEEQLAADAVSRSEASAWPQTQHHSDSSSAEGPPLEPAFPSADQSSAGKPRMKSVREALNEFAAAKAAAEDSGGVRASFPNDNSASPPWLGASADELLAESSRLFDEAMQEVRAAAATASGQVLADSQNDNPASPPWLGDSAAQRSAELAEGIQEFAAAAALATSRVTATSPSDDPASPPWLGDSTDELLAGSPGVAAALTEFRAAKAKAIERIPANSTNDDPASSPWLGDSADPAQQARTAANVLGTQHAKRAQRPQQHQQTRDSQPAQQAAESSQHSAHPASGMSQASAHQHISALPNAPARHAHTHSVTDAVRVAELPEPEEAGWWDDSETAPSNVGTAQSQYGVSTPASMHDSVQARQDTNKQASSAHGVSARPHSRQDSEKQASTSYSMNTVWKDQRDVEALHGNVTGLQIGFLGTAGRQDCQTRSPSCIAVRANKAVILFDCGEDAQRQLMQQPQLGHSRIHRIFITSNSCESVYGLPGMLCTLSWARERGFEDADIPIHVYGPPGIADYVRSMLLLSDTYSMVPILIHEFSTAPCDPEPEKILERGRLYRVRLPPDQLNPDGYYDGTLKKAFLARFNRKKKTGRADLRATMKKMRLPEPGDPSRTDVVLANMSWTISCDEDFAVTAFALPHTQPCWGYCLQEADRVGSLDVMRAEELGVPPGRAYGQLKAGESVLNSEGQVVSPEQVIGPDQLGRKIAILGTTSSPGDAVQWAQQAHTVVAAVPAQAHVSSAVGIAARTDAIGAKQLILTHLDDNDARTDDLVRQSADNCKAFVHAAYDHLVSVLDRPKGHIS